MVSHIDYNLIALLPSILLVQPQTLRRRFDVRSCIVTICGREAFADEHGAQAFSLVGGIDDEEVEDCVTVSGSHRESVARGGLAVVFIFIAILFSKIVELAEELFVQGHIGAFRICPFRIQFLLLRLLLGRQAVCVFPF